MNIKMRYFSIFVAALVLILSGIALVPRVKTEFANRNVGILIDYRDVVMLAQNSNRASDEVLKELVSSGVTGLMVSELTGEMMSSGGLPIYYGTAEGSAETRLSGEKGSLMIIPQLLPYSAELFELLQLRFGAKRFDLPQGTGVILPFTMWHMEKFGVAPDLEGLYEAEKLGLPVFWRPAQALNGETQNALVMLAKILEKHKNIKIVAPVGDIALGFPDMARLAGVLRDKKIPAAQIEFSRQLGAPQLDSLMFPNLIPLHSVTQEEMTSRNLTRLALYERLIRAATERSVRMLMFRPSQSGTSGDPVGEFAAEVKMLRDGLSARGLTVGHPENVFENVRWRASMLGVIACSIILIYTLFMYYRRFNHETEDVDLKTFLFFMVCCAFLAAAALYSRQIVAMVGAFASVFVVIEASLTAMDSWKRPVLCSVKGFLVALVGGLAIAAMFSEPLYILRIRAFSGVKMTLLLPPLLVLLYDLHRRIHPESLKDILSRPPLWGELVLAAVLLAGAGIILFRSDNVRVVPGFEAKMREFLERALVARPRNKEIVLGFPCLLLYCYAMSKGLWVKYREILRLGVVIGFSSVVNSFCHFHTPLFFIVIRQLNGLWVGLLVGVVAVAGLHFVALPLYRKFQGIID